MLYLNAVMRIIIMIIMIIIFVIIIILFNSHLVERNQGCFCCPFRRAAPFLSHSISDSSDDGATISVGPKIADRHFFLEGKSNFGSAQLGNSWVVFGKSYNSAETRRIEHSALFGEYRQNSAVCRSV